MLSELKGIKNLPHTIDDKSNLHSSHADHLRHSLCEGKDHGASSEGAAVADDWGMIEESGILIVPGDDETVSDDGHEEAVKELSELLSSQVKPKDVSFVEHNDDREEKAEAARPSFDPSLSSDIPSELESLPDPLDVSSNRTSNSKPAEPGASVVRGNDERTRDGKDQELVFLEAIFGAGTGNTASTWRKRWLFLTAITVVAIFVSCTTLFLHERRAWQASNQRLEALIAQLQFDLMTKIENEKKQDVQRIMEFDNFKQELKQTLIEREHQVQQRYDMAAAEERLMKQHYNPAAAARLDGFGGPNLFLDSSSHRKNSDGTIEDLSSSFGCKSKNKFSEFFFDIPSNFNSDDKYHLDNCWIQAEAKLGECAQEARNVVRSKLRTFGRSLWNVQEQFAGKVNDFGKRVHTAAKEAAEHVLSEAEQWSVHNSWKPTFYPKDNETQNHTEGLLGKHFTSSYFRTMAATLASSVAFASLAALVVDKASTYIIGYDEED